MTQPSSIVLTCSLSRSETSIALFELEQQVFLGEDARYVGSYSSLII